MFIQSEHFQKGFVFFTTVFMKITISLDVTQCSLLDDAGSGLLRNVGTHLPDYTASRPGRQKLSLLIGKF